MNEGFKVPPIALRLGAFIVLLACIAAFFQTFAPVYLSNGNLHGLLRHMAVNGLAAIGLTFVIVVRQFDLSFPGVASLGAMTLGFLLAAGYSLSLSISGGIAIGILAGVLNGTVIAYLRLPDIVATIATGGVAIGLSYFYSNGTSISENFFMSGILDLNDAKVLTFDMPVVILAAAAVIAGIVLHASRFGRAFYATGENRVSARFSGIRVKLYVLAAFALCGAMSCLAITLLVASSGAANVTAGNQLLMPAFAAVYLGAALFGAPSIPATLAGTLLMSAMLNGFTLLAIPYYYSDAIVSLVLIAAISIFDPKLTAALGNLLGGRMAR
ncbi:ribose/xylose/arabinose/galactoside ABC-type transport system permease subunit [Rhizobium skierniewicense]|uniref:Ribose/xylose/arabinose/galactoside ABC-type transport system permease subunit n=1 Tax=Rhizobium skierniewicense TaxID=984260 RepID=A0A7W6CA63_9HYPH|nr:ABC transporter permease [Rhizobium skierniewicense]MBB3948503.1 ribose/xylose/arabinose/galactoside ABC-type transport system permease subunit [Rhizobium skierniewicense]